MPTYFPSLTPVAGIPILAFPAAALLLLLFGAVLFLRWYKRKLAAFQETPEYQIQQLAKKTTDFGVQFSEIVFGKLLGKGSQGEVFLATWRGLSVAVKKVDTRTVPPEIIEEFCGEADIMRRLRHPCLTLFMGVSLEHPHLCIVTELVNRGALFDILQEESAGFTWRRALQIMVDIAAGITYLHAHNPPIIHRDLKSLNVLVTSSWRGKVTDFGMSRFQAAPSEDKTMTQCGSPLWMAPEMIKNEAYDEKADVYSFSIVLWELYTRRVPYRELNLNPSALVVKVVRDGLRPEIPKGCPKKFQALLKACWHKDSAKRPAFSEILKTLESFLNDPAMLQHKPQLADGTFEEDEEEDEEMTRSTVSTTKISNINTNTTTNKSKKSTTSTTTKVSTADGLGGPEVERAIMQDSIAALEKNGSAALKDGWAIPDRKDLEVSNIRILGDKEQKPSTHLQTVVEDAKNHNQQLSFPTPLVSPSPSNPRAKTGPPSGQESELFSTSSGCKVFRAKYRGKNVVVKKYLLNLALIQRSNSTAVTPNAKGGPTPKANRITTSMPVPMSPSDALQVSHGHSNSDTKTPQKKSLTVNAAAEAACVIPSDFSPLNHPCLVRLLRDLYQIRHPNLCLFMGAYVEYDHVAIVEEEMSRGSLHHILASNHILDWEIVMQMLIDGASGMAALEAVGRYHADLNTTRLLVTNNWRVKISGYSFVHLDRKLVEMDEQETLADSKRTQAEAGGGANADTSHLATLLRTQESPVNLWSAPETFEQDDLVSSLSTQETNGTKHFSSDAKDAFCNVYSWGMIMWHVLTRRIPFDGKFGPKLRKKIHEGFRLPLPNTITPRFKTLIKSCWSSDRSKRPSFMQIVTELRTILKEGPPVVKLDATNSKLYRKSATVFAYPSKDPITFFKDTGLQRGQKGGLLVCASVAPHTMTPTPTEEYWSTFTDLTTMDPEVFNRMYEPTNQYPNQFRKIGTVRAKRMDEPFAIRTGVVLNNSITAGGYDDPAAGGPAQASGMIEQGMAGDYICQNETGDQWVTDGKSMETIYVELIDPNSPVTTNPPPLVTTHHHHHTSSTTQQPAASPKSTQLLVSPSASPTPSPNSAAATAHALVQNALAKTGTPPATSPNGSAAASNAVSPSHHSSQEIQLVGMGDGKLVEASRPAIVTSGPPSPSNAGTKAPSPRSASNASTQGRIPMPHPAAAHASVNPNAVSSAATTPTSAAATPAATPSSSKPAAKKFVIKKTAAVADASNLPRK